MCVVLAHAAGGTSMSGGQGPRFSFTLVQPVSWTRDPCNRLRTRSARGPAGSISTQRCRTTITCSEVCACFRRQGISHPVHAFRVASGGGMHESGGGMVVVAVTWISWLEWLLSDSDRVKRLLKTFSRFMSPGDRLLKALRHLDCSVV